MADLSLLILAAGMGSRYGGLKQVDPVGPHGEIVMDYAIHDAIAAGFDKIVFVIRRDIEAAFREAIGDRFAERLEVAYAFQELDDLPAGFNCPAAREKPWGTGHAVRAARDVIDEPFCVINADDFYGRSSFEQVAAFLKDAAAGEYCMSAYELQNTLSEHGSVSRGVCTLNADGYLAAVKEYTKISRQGDAIVYDLEGDQGTFSGEEAVSLNFWGFTPDLFAALEERFIAFLKTDLETPKSEFYIPAVVDDLIHSGQATVKVLRSPDHWFGVTYPDDKAAVVASIQKLIDAGRYPERL